MLVILYLVIMEALNSANEYRGYFIEEFSKLERAIDMFLSTYFFPNDSEMAHTLIVSLIDRIPFENKRTALKYLLEKKNWSEISYNKSGRSSQFSKLLNEISEMGQIRNKFAHYPLVTSFGKTDEAIGLLRFRDDLKTNSYTVVEFWQIIARINGCTNKLYELYNEL
jgi:hypothetical protein